MSVRAALARVGARPYRAVRRRGRRVVVAVDTAIAWLLHRTARSVYVRDAGRGGPLLVVVDDVGFSRYLVEILRAEGISSFRAADAAQVGPELLVEHDLVLLGPISVDASLVDRLTTWVEGGGNLVAIRPDPRLASLLGLEPLGGREHEGYIRVDVNQAPGIGITDRSMQVHGDADRYRLAGARSVAGLCDRNGAPTGYPAITLHTVGPNGGQAAAFTYDLPRSIVYTRQGNPSWAGQNRDGDLLTRSNDLFFGDAAADPQPDWIDRKLLDLPQADEQQRLLVRLLQHLSAGRRPLPQFWYLPRDLRAAIVMTGDDHAFDGTAERFAQYASFDGPGDSVDDWTSVRATAYMYARSGLTDAAAAALQEQGFEICPHVTTDAHEWTPASLTRAYRRQLASFRRKYPSLAPPASHRLHAVVWSDWSTQAEVERAHGIRLDTNYYLYPPTWSGEGAGFFTGSGLAMRFADPMGRVIDCYQAATHLTDESEQAFPDAIDAALERALRPGGHVTVLTANMHTDLSVSTGSDAIVAAARRRRVPVISARQLLTWLDGRSASWIGPVERSGTALRFSVTVDDRARHLRLLVPLPPGCGAANTVTFDGAAVVFEHELIGGVLNVSVPASTGFVEIQCSSRSPAPVVRDVEVVATSTDARVSWRSSAPARGTATLVGDGGQPTTVEEPDERTRHGVVFNGLQPGARYRVSIGPGAPTDGDLPFTTQNEPIVHDGVDNFMAGVFDGTMASPARGGSLTLVPELFLDGRAQLRGWDAGRCGVAVDVHGVLVSAGGLILGSEPLEPGRSFEVEAVLSPGAGQFIGFVDRVGGDAAALFTVSPTRDLTVTVRAAGTSRVRRIPWRCDDEPHRFRIEWARGLTTFTIDGRSVASERIPLVEPLRPAIGATEGGTHAVHISWASVSPYVRTGSYESSVIDNGSVAGWGRVWLKGPAITMTGATTAVRTGNTPIPDDTWSAWKPVDAAGAPLTVRTRYLQYRLHLVTATTRGTPEVTAVVVERTP